LFANFFQELAVATKHESFDEHYLVDVFAYLVSRYGDSLLPYINEIRIKHNRPSLYQDFIEFCGSMKIMEAQYKNK
jgi:hypothetical protein